MPFNHFDVIAGSFAARFSLSVSDPVTSLSQDDFQPFNNSDGIRSIDVVIGTATEQTIPSVFTSSGIF